MAYIKRKGFIFGGVQDRPESRKYLLPEQVNAILKAIEDAAPLKPEIAPRDHALIYLSYQFGLRVGEAVILERRHFRHISDGQAYLPTLKQSPLVLQICSGCGRENYISARKKQAQCKGCGEITKVNRVAVKQAKKTHKPPELSVELIEPETIAYVERYLDKLGSQYNFLFPRSRGGKNGKWQKRFKVDHIGERTAERIFDHWCHEAGLPKQYSFHSLRHGRGVHVFENLEDFDAAKRALRHKNQATTEVYMHMSPRRRKEQVERLSDGGVAANPL